MIAGYAVRDDGFSPEDVNELLGISGQCARRIALPRRRGGDQLLGLHRLKPLLKGRARPLILVVDSASFHR